MPLAKTAKIWKFFRVVTVDGVTQRRWLKFHSYLSLPKDKSTSQLINHLKSKGYEKQFKEYESDTPCKIYDDWQKIADKGLTMNPPREPIPRDEFTLNNYSKLGLCYMNNTFNNQDLKYQEAVNKKWTQELIDSYITDGKKNIFNKFLIYADSMSLFYAMKFHDIKNKVGAVIGSLSPWAEVFCLLNGARHVFTVDYQKSDITHPNISFVHALNLVKNYKLYQNDLDFVASFSSIEHSGLGRYGDPIDPFGDVKEMQKIKCLLKPGSLFFLLYLLELMLLALTVTGIMDVLGFELVNVFVSEETPHELNIEDLEKDFEVPSSEHMVFVLRETKAFDKHIF